MDSTKKGNNSEKAVHSPTGQGIETGRSTRILSATFASERLMPLLCQIYLYSSILAIIRASVFLPGISCPRNHIQKKMLLLGDVWSAGRLYTCTKSEAFKVYQTLCLGINELYSSGAIKSILLRAVGVTGRSNAADLLLHWQGGTGLWSS